MSKLWQLLRESLEALVHTSRLTFAIASPLTETQGVVHLLLRAINTFQS